MHVKPTALADRVHHKGDPRMFEPERDQLEICVDAEFASAAFDELVA